MIFGGESICECFREICEENLIETEDKIRNSSFLYFFNNVNHLVINDDVDRAFLSLKKI